MTPAKLTKGHAYYRVTFADPEFTIPGVEPMIFVGVDLFDEEKGSEPRYYFQDTISFQRHGNCTDYSGPRFSEDDTPFNVYSCTEDEMAKGGLVDLPEVVRLVSEANERAGQNR
jgi:hypothetical protein